MTTEMERFNSLTARLGEFYKDHLVIIRTGNGGVAWRASDPRWSESAAREYVDYVRMSTQIKLMDDFNGRNER